ncbi:MAG: hypothetical protein U0235_07605 [Polyangiaceae bacterium]
MWSNFWEAGGWGMKPVAVFGFMMIVSSVLYVLRPEDRGRRLVLTFTGLTIAAGVLGTTTGICNSIHFLEKVDAKDQFHILSLGVEESLHNLILSLILVVLGGLVSAVGTLRTPRAGVTATAAR